MYLPGSQGKSPQTSGLGVDRLVETRLEQITVDLTSTSQSGDKGNNMEIMGNRSPDGSLQVMATVKGHALGTKTFPHKAELMVD